MILKGEPSQYVGMSAYKILEALELEFSDGSPNWWFSNEWTILCPDGEICEPIDYASIYDLSYATTLKVVHASRRSEDPIPWIVVPRNCEAHPTSFSSSSSRTNSPIPDANAVAYRAISVWQRQQIVNDHLFPDEGGSSDF